MDLQVQLQVLAAAFHAEIKSVVCYCTSQATWPGNSWGVSRLCRPSPTMSFGITVIRYRVWLYVGAEDPELPTLEWQVLYPLSDLPSPWRAPSHSRGCLLVLSTGKGHAGTKRHSRAGGSHGGVQGPGSWLKAARSPRGSKLEAQNVSQTDGCQTVNLSLHWKEYGHCP